MNGTVSTKFDLLPFYIPGQRTMRYAGIGSRQAPTDVLIKMTQLAKALEARGYTLLSGGAEGSDKAFEAGAKTKVSYSASDAGSIAIAIAKEIHPRPELLKPYPLRLMARNCYEVFGRHLNSPVDFLLCWTPDGCESHTTRTFRTGGTGQAIEMASRKGIPVLNLENADWRSRLLALL